MGGWITSLEDMIYGDDGQSPIKGTLERVLGQAKSDDCRLGIEIRAQADGTPNSRQEHKFAADPETATVDGIMRVLVQRLAESPGEHFAGELRINFYASGSSQERYGSFTRTIRRAPPNIRGAPGMARMRTVHEGSDDDDELDNDTAALGGFGFDNMGAPPGGVPGYVPQEQVLQWLETAFGFTFRSMAQQMAMFERSTRMMESYTLRFGMPHPTERGIVEQRGGDNGGDGGMGILPMLMKAAQHLASAENPEQLADRAGSMAAGNPPPRGQTRAAAIGGAAKLIQGIPRGHDQRFSTYDPSPAPVDPSQDPDQGGGGGGAFFDDDAGFDGFGGGQDDNAMTHYNDDDGPRGGGGGRPDLRGLSAEEAKGAFLEWVRDNPANKAAVMDMLPELAKEMT